MLFDRFDYAVLWLFSHDSLAAPFTIEQRSADEWEVMQGGQSCGRITQRPMLNRVAYRAEKP